MRVALVQSSGRYMPLGLLAIASYIEKYGHKPQIIDLDVSCSSSRLIKSSADRIIETNPQIIGFSVLCSFLPLALLIAEECKCRNPNIPIVFGGPEVSFDEVLLMNTFPQIDVIVRGEGELTFGELLEAFDNNASLEDIEGITYRSGSSVVKNPSRHLINDLDELPKTNYSLLPKKYTYYIPSIEGGRGCHYNCTFCSTCKMWRRTFRLKSPQRMASDLTDASNKYNAEIQIVHDNFLNNRTWLDTFMKLMRGKGIEWSCNARFDILDENLVRKLKIAGCRGIFVGIESGSARIRRRIKKQLCLRNYWHMLKCFEQKNLWIIVSFVIGFPGERESDIEQTLLLALRTRLRNEHSYVRIHFFNFLKGSQLYEEWRGHCISNPYGSVLLSKTRWVSPLSGLQEEMRLIAEHPETFPSFFRVDKPNHQSDYLQKIAIIYEYLFQFYPATTMLMINMLSESTLNVCKKILSYLEDEGIDLLYIARNPKEYFEYYRTSFKSFLYKGPIRVRKLVYEMHAHEDLLTELCSTSNAMPNSKKMFVKNKRLCLNDRVIINKYEHDLLAVEKALKNGRQNYRRNVTYLAYVPGNCPKVVSLTRQHIDLIKLCDGRNSANDICRLLGGEENTRYKITGLLEKLVAENIIE